MHGIPPPSQLPPGIDEGGAFRALFSAYPDALVVVDANGKISLANAAASGLLGYAMTELVGLDVDRLVPDGFRASHAAQREGYRRQPRPRPMGTQMELVARRRDGSEVMVEIALSPVQYAGTMLVVAAIRDVSAYPRIKQAMRRARYSEAVAQLGRVAVDSRDPQVLFDCLPALAAEALQADIVRLFLLEPDRRAFRIAAGQGALAGEEVGALVPNVPGSSAAIVIAHAAPLVIEDYAASTFPALAHYAAAGLASGLGVPLSDGGRLIGALIARSCQKGRFGGDEVRFLEALANLIAASLQRAQTEEALHHAQRMESVGQLTGGIAHDFNNLLTVILGNLQVLEDLPAVAGDGVAGQMVAAAVRASRRAAELTSKLLAFSRRQLLQPTAVDVAALLHSLADMLRRTLDQRIAIGVEIAPDCPPVRADPGQLESALLNIAINARDAMPEGGRLTFTAGCTNALPPAAANALEAAADAGGQAPPYVWIAIADTGDGMSDEVKERVFEPFFTTKEAGRGTGLGLATVYGFVRQSRGAITLDSVPGQGSTFTLYLPAVPQAQGAPGRGAEGVRAVPAGLRVLLVEDDAAVRAVARRFLEALDGRVVDAASAEIAALALGDDAPFDLVLSDVALGAGASGTELAARVRARWPRLPVLLMSGYALELADAALHPLLRKPFSREQLAAAIVQALAGAG